MLLGVGDAEAADDAGLVGEAGPGVGAAAVDDADAVDAVDDPDDPDAGEAGPSGLDREAPAVDDTLEHPPLSTRATPIPSAGTSQDRRTWARIGRWYGNYNRWQYCYGHLQIFDSTSVSNRTLLSQLATCRRWARTLIA